ncbi:B-box domain protein 31 [Linum perenne]
MKKCELCKSPARTYCESDDASLCWSCDAKVHGANFLVARHSRTLLCQSCQSATPWQAAGAKLGNTVSLCLRCANGDTNESLHLHHRVEVEESETEDEDYDEEEVEEDDEEEGDNQVVPWSSSSASTPPPPAASDSSDGDESDDPDRSLDLRYFPQDDISRRCCRQKYGLDGSSRPLKSRRREDADDDSKSSGRPI